MCKTFIFLFASHLLLVNALPFLKTHEHNEESYEESGYPDSLTDSFYFRSAPRQPFSPFHPIPYPLTFPSGIASSAVEYNRHGLPSSNLFNPPPHILSPDWWPLWIQQSHPSRFIIHKEKQNNHDESIMPTHWNPYNSKDENNHQDGTDSSKAKKDTSLLEIAKYEENDDEEDVQKDSLEKPTDELMENNEEHACEEAICPAVTESQQVSEGAGNVENTETLLLDNQTTEPNTGIVEDEQNKEYGGIENKNGPEEQNRTDAPETSITPIDSSPDKRLIGAEAITQEQDIIKAETSENYEPSVTVDFIGQVTTEASQLDVVPDASVLVPSAETLLDETIAESEIVVTTKEPIKTAEIELLESTQETTPDSLFMQNSPEDFSGTTKPPIEDHTIQIPTEEITTVENLTDETAMDIFPEKTPSEVTQETNQQEEATEVLNLASAYETPFETPTNTAFIEEQPVKIVNNEEYVSLDRSESKEIVSDAENISPDHTEFSELTPTEGIVDGNVAAVSDIKELPSEVTKSVNYQGVGGDDSNQNTESYPNDQVNSSQGQGDEMVELEEANSEGSEIGKEIETTENIVELLSPTESSFTTEGTVLQQYYPKEIEQLAVDIVTTENEESKNSEMSIEIITENSPSLPNVEIMEGEVLEPEPNFEDAIKHPSEIHEVSAAEVEDDEDHSHSLDISDKMDHDYATHEDHNPEYEYHDQDYHESYDELGGHEIHEDREDSPSPINTFPEVADEEDDATDEQEGESSEEGDPQVQINGEVSNQDNEGGEEDIYKKRHTLLGENRDVSTSEGKKEGSHTKTYDVTRNGKRIEFVSDKIPNAIGSKKLNSDSIEPVLDIVKDNFDKVTKDTTAEVGLEPSTRFSADNVVENSPKYEAGNLPVAEIKDDIQEITILGTKDTTEKEDNFNADQTNGNIADNQQITKLEEIAPQSAEPASVAFPREKDLSDEKQLLPKITEAPLIKILNDAEIIEPKIFEGDKETKFSENEASTELKQNSKEVKFPSDAEAIQPLNYSEKIQTEIAENSISSTMVSHTISEGIGDGKVGESAMSQKTIQETAREEGIVPDTTKNEKIIAALIDDQVIGIIDADKILIPDEGKKEAVEIEKNDKSKLNSFVTETKDKSIKETKVLVTTEDDRNIESDRT